MGASGLRVIRFVGAGLRESHELAFCVPLPCSMVRVIYSDREVVCTAPELATALEVDLKALLSKAHVLAAVECGFDAIRAKLPCYEDVRCTLVVAVFRRMGSTEQRTTQTAPPTSHVAGLPGAVDCSRASACDAGIAEVGPALAQSRVVADDARRQGDRQVHAGVPGG